MMNTTNAKAATASVELLTLFSEVRLESSHGVNALYCANGALAYLCLTTMVTYCLSLAVRYRVSLNAFRYDCQAAIFRMHRCTMGAELLRMATTDTGVKYETKHVFIET